jgi:hypothetical protein
VGCKDKNNVRVQIEQNRLDVSCLLAFESCCAGTFVDRVLSIYDSGYSVGSKKVHSRFSSIEMLFKGFIVLPFGFN